MRVERHLIYKALIALSEAAQACRDAPLKPDYALRFALAYLYTCSNGERRPYDLFWQAIRDEQARAYHPDQGRYIRSTHANAALEAIMRGLAFEPTVTAEHILRNAHSGDRSRESSAEAFWREVEKQVAMGRSNRRGAIAVGSDQPSTRAWAACRA